MDNVLYNNSNAVTEVAYNRLSKKEYAALLKATEKATDRQKRAQIVCDYLSNKYGIQRVFVCVLDTPQRTFSNGNGKVLGDYMPNYNRIRVWNRTAKTHKVVSIKVFADTLLHEFVHHYDYKYLKLGGSLHTKGFYLRISDLKKKLS